MSQKLRRFGLLLVLACLLSFSPINAATKPAPVPIRVCGSFGRQANTIFTEALQAKYAHITVQIERLESTNSLDEFKKQLVDSSCDLYISGAETAVTVQNLGAELFSPLDPYIGRDRFDLGPFGSLIELGRYSGVQYALPVTVAPVVVYYNKSLFAAVGLASPDQHWTWEEFRDIAIILDAGRQKRTVMLHPSTWAYMVGEAGGDTLSTPPIIFEKTLDWLNEMLSDGTVTVAASERNFYEGNRSPMIVTSMGSIPSQGWVGVAPLPAIGEGMQAAPVSATMISICATSQHKQDAWLAAKFISGPDGAAIQSYLRTVPAYRSAAVASILRAGINHTEALNVIEAMRMAVPKSHYASHEASFRSQINNSLKTLADGKLLPHEVLQVVAAQQVTLQNEAQKAAK